MELKKNIKKNQNKTETIEINNLIKKWLTTDTLKILGLDNLNQKSIIKIKSIINENRKHANTIERLTHEANLKIEQINSINNKINIIEQTIQLAFNDWNNILNEKLTPIKKAIDLDHDYAFQLRQILQKSNRKINKFTLKPKFLIFNKSKKIKDYQQQVDTINRKFVEDNKILIESLSDIDKKIHTLEKMFKSFKENDLPKFDEIKISKREFELVDLHTKLDNEKLALEKINQEINYLKVVLNNSEKVINIHKIAFWNEQKNQILELIKGDLNKQLTETSEKNNDVFTKEMINLNQAEINLKNLN